MADRPRLYFTIGPVQTFVAQSRRTRDLWASSYLLSHLADVAMQAIEEVGGQIVLPYRGHHLQEVAATKGANTGTQHGRWPNRFVAEVDEPKEAALKAKAALDASWQEIAKAVWQRWLPDLVSASKKTATIEHRKVPHADRFEYEAEAIWTRQVDNFWEVSWAIAASPSAGEPDPLAQRKNWRTTPVTVEPGDHCTMMGDYQELSGFIRSRERHDQNEFWQSLRETLGGLHLGKDERLCAISLIKRMFPLIAKDVIGTDLQGASWPSTPYIAAVRWLGHVGSRHADAGRAYASFIADKAGRAMGERNARIHSLMRIQTQQDVGDLFRLDGNYFHETALANSRDTPLGMSEAEDARARGEILERLGRLYEKVGSRPSSFFALLLMDGDSMGRLLSEARSKSSGCEQEVTRALGQFADRVPDTVRENDGVTVYCGGDDVLAMLPVETALRCALALSALYQRCFADVCQTNDIGQATISAGVVYCPFRAPLREVLETAHNLLDHVAKEQTGRDSLAVAVMKSASITAQWSAPWEHVRAGEQTILDSLAQRLGRTDDRPGELSSGFLFQIRERFARLTDESLNEPGQFGRLPADVDLHALLRAEYVRVCGRQDVGDAAPTFENADEVLDLLLKVCRRVHRGRGVDEGTLGIDGPLIVRFLTSEAQEVEA